MKPQPITPAVQRKLQHLLKHSGKKAPAATASTEASYPWLIIPAKLLIIHNSLHMKSNFRISKHFKLNNVSQSDVFFVQPLFSNPEYIYILIICIHINCIVFFYCVVTFCKIKFAFSHFQIQYIKM